MSQLSQPVTILGIDANNGVSAKTGRPWTLYKVKASDGQSYDTFDAQIAQKAKGASGAVTLAFDVREQNGFTNNDLKDVLAPQGQTPQTQAISVPTASLATASLTPVSEPSTFQQDKEARITRLSAASTAFEYSAAAGGTIDETFALAARIERYAFTGQTDQPAPLVVPAPQQEDSLPWETDQAA